MRPDQLKGHLDPLLLAVLEGGPAHGYALIEALRDVSARRRRRVLAEAADHLAESGAVVGADEAVRRFGPASRFAAEINASWAIARARRAPGVVLVALTAVLAAAVAGIPSVPPS